MLRTRRSNFSWQTVMLLDFEDRVNQSTIEVQAKECFSSNQCYIAHSMFQRRQTFRTVIQSKQSIYKDTSISFAYQFLLQNLIKLLEHALILRRYEVRGAS